jgi:hypothetical protein
MPELVEILLTQFSDMSLQKNGQSTPKAYKLLDLLVEAGSIIVAIRRSKAISEN